MNGKMKIEQAREKAKELWGDNAFAEIQFNVFAFCTVGEIQGSFVKVYGIGHSWDDAFENAKKQLN